MYHFGIQMNHRFEEDRPRYSHKIFCPKVDVVGRCTLYQFCFHLPMVEYMGIGLIPGRASDSTIMSHIFLWLGCMHQCLRSPHMSWIKTKPGCNAQISPKDDLKTILKQGQVRRMWSLVSRFLLQTVENTRTRTEGFTIIGMNKEEKG